jgi:hypothetical protein
MSKLLKLIIIIILIFISSISQAQTTEDIAIEVGILESEVGSWSGFEITSTEAQYLWEKFVKLCEIPEDERTVEQWKEIIRIILLLQYNDIVEDDNVILLLLTLQQENIEKTESIEKLMNVIETLTKKLESKIKELEKISKERDDLLKNIEDIKVEYDKQIAYLTNIIEKLKNKTYHIVTLTPTLAFTNEFDLGFQYLFNIGWLELGAIVEIQNLLGNSLGLGIGISIGIKF